MKSLAITAAILLATALPAAAQSLDGHYNVRGKNADGNLYTGAVEIVGTGTAKCRIVWHTGGDTVNGVCIRNTSTFAASFRTAKSTGVAIYVIEPDGSLEGNWTIGDNDVTGTESLLPQK